MGSNLIPGQTTHQGVLNIGPRMAYPYVLGIESTLTPWFEIEGSQAFGDSHGFTGQTSAGIDFAARTGMTLSASSAVSGLGSSDHSYALSFGLRVPLQ